MPTTAQHRQKKRRQKKRDDQRGGRRQQRPLQFTIKLILGWADRFQARTGRWPRIRSGHTPELPKGIQWTNVNHALFYGLRSLPGGSSLARLLAKQRGVPNQAKLPKLSQNEVLRWADAFHARTGDWPTRTSGYVPEGKGLWCNIDAAMTVGHRGLPGGTSLAKLLRERRGVGKLPKLSVKQILKWAEAYHARHGGWPTLKSGDIPGTRSGSRPADTWLAIDTALRKGSRGLRGGSSLAMVLRKIR
jgi:hypothetical protein